MDTKKSPRKNLENKRTLFLEIGFVLVLAFVLLAFQYRITERSNVIIPDSGQNWADQDYIPPNIPKPPPPPPPESHEIVTAPDDLIDDDFFPDVDIDAYPDVFVPEYPPIDFGNGDGEQPDPSDDIILRPEFWPEFPGGLQALYKYFGNVIRYPRQAQELGIEGTVFVGFVVEKDGSITNVHLQRGIGGGCDEEALKAVENMPNWTPGRMGTQPVRVRYSVPVVFRLSR